MLNITSKLILCFFGLLFVSQSFSQTANNKMGGITMVAPPNEFNSNPMPAIKEINTSWLAIVPYGFNRVNDPNLRFNLPMQWWGERKEGIVESIRLAHQAGMKIMLKPQVYIPGSWVGDMDFETEEDWQTWEKAYTSYINFYLQIAIEEEVELFCVGTEFKIAVQKRTDYWLKLIEDIRCKYNGMLTYSSNWDAFNKNPLWADLDYIGISSYFPLSDKKTPSTSELKKAWKPIVTRLKKYSEQIGKQILFTEMGYLAVDQCANKTWELEKMVYDLPVNEVAQANAFDALFASFWNQDFWGGGFIWKWYPNKKGITGYFERDYTPQEKACSETIKKWYSNNNSK